MDGWTDRQCIVNYFDRLYHHIMLVVRCCNGRALQNRTLFACLLTVSRLPAKPASDLSTSNFSTVPSISGCKIQYSMGLYEIWGYPQMATLMGKIMIP